MSKQLLVGLGALLVLVGALWTGQGVGLIGGSAMTDETLWAVVGPIVALGGAAMVLTGARMS
ncbi:conserved exported hypothetical protein [metagenome]|uniref:Integral membrane protein n=1 Tax=metagenome TaxID=256318 RepID=A0A2P2CEU0_9ZZZZ